MCKTTPEWALSLTLWQLTVAVKKQREKERESGGGWVGVMPTGRQQESSDTKTSLGGKN